MIGGVMANKPRCLRAQSAAGVRPMSDTFSGKRWKTRSVRADNFHSVAIVGGPIFDLVRGYAR
jgi:hypothetical protein